MPCGCFGKKKTAAGETEKVPPSEIKYSPSPDVKKICGDSKNKRKEVASDRSEECAPLLSSGPPNSNVDYPTSNSHTNTHTPSTLPVVASSASSQASSSVTSSPAPSRIVAAYSRSQLAEKRREFFIELYPVEKGGSARYIQASSPSTLPTIARARHFGKVRNVRPVSQPSSPVDPPIPDAPTLPGPHLLHHHVESPRDSTKIDAKGDGLSSDEFLLELKNASDEISKRWANAEVDVPEYTSYALKMDAVEYTNDKLLDEGAAIELEVAPSDAPHSESPRSPPNSPALSHPSQSSGVPETLITPPSPQFPPEALLSQLSSQSPYSEVVSGANEDLQHTEKEYYVEDEFSVQEDHRRSHSTLDEEEEYIESEDDHEEDFDLIAKRITDLKDESFDLSDQPTTEGYPYYTEPVAYEITNEKQRLVDLEPSEIPAESKVDKEHLRGNNISKTQQDPATDQQTTFMYQEQPIVEGDQELLLKDGSSSGTV